MMMLPRASVNESSAFGAAHFMSNFLVSNATNDYIIPFLKEKVSSKCLLNRNYLEVERHFFPSERPEHEVP